MQLQLGDSTTGVIIKATSKEVAKNGVKHYKDLYKELRTSVNCS